MLLRTGIEAENQRLLFAGRDILETRNDQVMKISDYGIVGNVTIVLVVRLPGGS